MTGTAAPSDTGARVMCDAPVVVVVVIAAAAVDDPRCGRRRIRIEPPPLRRGDLDEIESRLREPAS